MKSAIRTLLMTTFVATLLGLSSCNTNDSTYVVLTNYLPGNWQIVSAVLVESGDVVNVSRESIDQYSNSGNYKYLLRNPDGTYSATITGTYTLSYALGEIVQTISPTEKVYLDLIGVNATKLVTQTSMKNSGMTAENVIRYTYSRYNGPVKIVDLAPLGR